MWSRFVRRLLGLASALAILCLGEAPRASLSGKVEDPSGRALPRARVEVFSRTSPWRQATFADAVGNFAFSDVPPGEYLVEASAEGFGSAAQTALRVDRQQPAPVTLRVTLAPVVSQVQVTASTTAQTVDETAKAISGLEQSQLDRRREFALVESLRLTPGVQVQQLGGPGASARIQIRGMRTSDTALLIDGMRFRDVASTQGDASGFFQEMLLVNSERVEVLRGSGASLYGANAIGGLVHLSTNQGGGTPHGEIYADAGGLGLMRGGCKFGGGWRERLLYSAGLTHLNVTRGVDKDDRHRNTSGQTFGKMFLTPKAAVTARLLGGDAFTQINVSPYAAPAASLPLTGRIRAAPLGPDQVGLAEPGLPFSWSGATFAPALNDPDSRRSAQFLASMAALDHQASPGLAYRVGYSGVATSRRFIDGPVGPGFQPRSRDVSEFSGRIDTAQMRADWQPARWNLLTIGYEFEREFYRNLASNDDPNPSTRASRRVEIVQRSNTVFVHNQTRLLEERLQVSLSGRYQGFHLGRPKTFGERDVFAGADLASAPSAYTKDASIAYFWRATGTKLRAHAGNGYRAPSVYERFGSSLFAGSLSVFGDPNLRPERSVAFDAGLDQYLAGRRARLSATYFYTRLQEVIAFGPVPRDATGRLSGYFNTGGGLARGVELSGGLQPCRSLTLEAAYTYTNALERVSTLDDGDLRSPRIFAHMVTVLATQHIGRNVDITFDFMGASDGIVPFRVGRANRAFVFPGPRKADLAVSYRFDLRESRAVELYTRVDNLFNQNYYEAGFRTPRRWAVAGFRFLF
jgi:iron complex outermembrane receptor protein